MAQTYSFMANKPQQSQNQNQNSGSNGWDAIDPPEMGATLSQSKPNDRPNSDAWWANYHDQFGRYNAKTNPGPGSPYSGGYSWDNWGQQSQGDMGTWDPTVGMSQPQQNQGVQAGASPGMSFQLPQGYSNTFEFWSHPDRAQTINNYANTMIPLSQLNQNAYQYAMDFNEAQRRDNRNFGWQQWTDQAGIDMGWADRALAQQAQDLAQYQWNQQFGFEANMANRQFGLEDYATREGVAQQWQQMQNQYDLENRALNIEDAYRTGMLSLEQRNMALQELANAQEYGLAQQQQALEHQLGMGGLDIDRQQLALQQQLGLGGLGLDQASLAQQWQRALLDAQLQREGYQNQQAIAAMQNFGRDQAPTSRWIRNY